MHVMVKPTGSLCNLDCSYCYYLSKRELLGRPEQWRMSEDVLEPFIRQYFEGQNHKEVVFSWQGGEPTLLGLNFFKKVVEIEKRYCPPHIRCENDLQTNGTNLDDAWCEYQFACFGECPKNRFIKTPDGRTGLNYLCLGWKKFFSHIDEPIQEIVRRLGETVRKEAVTCAAGNWVPETKEP
jgi:sulfatase maturation enzyme AslB (radical SAM superfamily)